MWSSPDHRRIDLQIPRHVLDVHNRTIDDEPSHAMLVSADSFAYHRFDTIAAAHHVRLEAAAVLVADSGTCFLLLERPDLGACVEPTARVRPDRLDNRQLNASTNDQPVRLAHEL